MSDAPRWDMLRASEPPQKSDRDEIVRALGLLVLPGSVVELRCLGTPKGTVSGYFGDMNAMADAAAEWSGQAKSVYFTLNPVLPDLLARACNRAETYVRSTTQDEHIQHRRLFLVDCDPVRPVGISANDAEHAAAIERCSACREWMSARGWADPILADSGNGGHLLYQLDAPNDDNARQALSDCLNAIAADLNDEHVTIDTSTFNASRISKLYGTLSAKGDHLPEMGRVHRIARILEVPSTWQ